MFCLSVRASLKETTAGVFGCNLSSDGWMDITVVAISIIAITTLVQHRDATQLSKSKGATLPYQPNTPNPIKPNPRTL